MHLQGTRGMAIGMRWKITEVGPEILASPRDSACGKHMGKVVGESYRGKPDLRFDEEAKGKWPWESD